MNHSYHIYGLVVVLHSQLFAGVTLMILPKFDLKQFLSYTAQYKIDIHYIVPPMAVLLVKSPDAQNADLSSMRDIMVSCNYQCFTLLLIDRFRLALLL